MRVLFDKGTPAPLRAALQDHVVVTALECGWDRLTDRELLDHAEADGFQVIVTTDQNLRHQMILTGRRLAILVLRTTDWRRIRERVETVVDALRGIESGGYIELSFPRSRPHDRLRRPARRAIWRVEIGDGRSPRQPGQVRKEAAVTSFAPGRLPVSTFTLSRAGPMTDILAEIETETPERDDATFDMFGAPQTPAPAAAYTVLARKYRPRNFDDLIGQEGMVRTLKNAFASGRIAHGFMLTGVRGVGKTTTARLLARALNYESDTVHEPSVADLAVEGVHCKAIIEGRHLDVLEIDAASRTGINEMKELLEGVPYGPANARFKVYIIDEIHMLSDKAFNALLKTLEEPPPHAKFIFATTEIRKVPVTILSRCQRFDLRRVEPEVIVANLSGIARAEGVAIDEDAMMLIARAAEGSVRDAQSLLDQALVQVDAGQMVNADLVRDMLGLADRAQSIGLFEMIARGDAGAAIPAFRALHAVGAEPATVMLDLLEHCHAASVARTIGPQALTLPRDQAARLTELGAALSAGSLARLWQMLLKGLDEVRRAPDPAAAVDMILIRLSYAAELPGPEEALKALRDGGPVLGSPDPRPPARTAQVGGGGVSAARAPLPQLSAQPSPSPGASALPSPATFEDVVALAGEKRDIGLKLDLEKYVRLISFRPGAIEFEATPGAPSNLTQRLVTRLKEWTGQPWLVAYKSGGGADTLLERQKRAHEASHAEALAEPLIQALLSAFPGAEVVDVRQIAPEVAAAPDDDTINPDD